MTKPLGTVLFDITNRCNLQCIFCQRKSFTPQFMTPETFRQILGKIAPQVQNFLLSCAWEYSTHPAPHELVSLLGEFALPHTIMFSNGNILSDETLAAILRAGVHKYVFSINEATPETYAYVRKGGRFERVTQNIRRLVEAKAQAGQGPTVAVNMTLLRSNIEELPDFVSLAAGLGVQTISGRHLILNKGLHMQEECIQDLDRADALIESAQAIADAAGISFEVPRFHAPKPAAKTCTAAWNQWHVASNGDVSICPRIHMHVCVGNIAEQSFEEIQQGPALRKLQAEFETRTFTNPVCALCLDNKENEIEIDQGL